jgi:uncharacterized protein
MQILIFSDIHNDTKALEALVTRTADWYVCAGDLVSWARGLDACGEILKPLAERLLILPGNHEDAATIEAFAQRFGFRAVHGHSITLGHHCVGFLGYSNPTPFNTPGEYSETEIARHLQPLRDPAPEVLVCHCPPHGTALDRMRNGQHAGSTAIREFVDAVQPRFFFSGHIHETEGVETRIGTTFATNPGKRGYLLDLPDASGPQSSG